MIALYNYLRDYDPATGRYVESDPIGLGGGANTFGYVRGNPINGFDPKGLECTSVGGFLDCAHPSGGMEFRLPSPLGFPAFLGPDNFWNFLNYHQYDVQVPLDGADARCVMQKMIEHPTPGNGSAATAQGTGNNAVVIPFTNNFVTSYLTSDLNNGNPLVVNLTIPGSQFPPGYVARTVSGGVAHTYGEGLNTMQSPWLAVPGFPEVQAGANEWVWGRQMRQFVKECSCGK